MLRRTPRDPSEPTRNKKSFLLKKQETRIPDALMLWPEPDFHQPLPLRKDSISPRSFSDVEMSSASSK